MLVSAAWLVPAVLAFLASIGQQALWSDDGPSLAQLFFDSLDWLVYALFVPVIFAISARWPVTGRDRRRGAWLVHLALALLFCVLWASLGIALQAALGTNDFAEGVRRAWLSWVYVTIPFGVGVYFGMVAIEHAFRHVEESRQWEAHVARTEAQLNAARLAALEARLNPHFLFNALNSIAVLVRDGANERANRAVEELSDLLRATLERNSAEIALEREVALVQRYLAVEELRFQDRLRATIDVPDELRAAAVPAFALQHLVENAVRHGIASSIAAGRISIIGRRVGGMLVLAVRDDGTGIADGAEQRDGHGLAHTRERLRALHVDRASLVVERHPDGGTVATLTLPWRELTGTADA
jgi:sensor histidine kinase YesM